MSELLPCPFCETDQLQLCSDSNNPDKSFVKCRRCKAQAPLKAWNIRHAEEIEPYKASIILAEPNGKILDCNNASFLKIEIPD